MFRLGFKKQGITAITPCEKGGILEEIPWALKKLFKREDEIYDALPNALTDDLAAALKTELAIVQKKIETFNKSHSEPLNFASLIQTAVDQDNPKRKGKQ